MGELLPEGWRGPGFPKPALFLLLSLPWSCSHRLSLLAEFSIEPASEKAKLCVQAGAKPFSPLATGLLNWEQARFSWWPLAGEVLCRAGSFPAAPWEAPQEEASQQRWQQRICLSAQKHEAYRQLKRVLPR